jgi:hypothetical protein
VSASSKSHAGLLWWFGAAGWALCAAAVVEVVAARRATVRAQEEHRDHGPSIGSDSWLVIHGRNPDAMVKPGSTLTRNVQGLVTEAQVLWPDGTAGTYIVTATDPDWPAVYVSSYTVTYEPIVGPRKTVTQPPMKRDGSAGVIELPGLVIT